MKQTYLFIKNIFDRILALALIAVLLPLIIIISITIKITSPGKVFFIHERVGKKGKTIKMYKFRTMVENAEELKDSFTPEQQNEWNQNFKLKDDFRETKFGRFLRKSCLDELPQLFNVIKGELSLIGPRPVTAQEIEKYEEDKDKVVEILPGITGYWQVYCNENTTYADRIKMELYYIDNVNIILDLKIFFKTFTTIIRKCRK